MRTLIVSPHFDDAPLSLGQSMIDGALRSHRVTVGVVFGRSDWVKWFHPTRSRAPIVGAIRRSEEIHAAVRFRYRLRVGRLEEAVLRLDTTDTSTFLDPTFDAEGSPLLPTVVAELSAWSRDVDLVICPLGVGHHVDHALCAVAGRQLAADGRQVAFYEDRPYCCQVEDDSITELAARLDPRLERRAASGAITSTKRRRLFYPSQFDRMFHDAAAFNEREGRREHVWVAAAAAWP